MYMMPMVDIPPEVCHASQEMTAEEGCRLLQKVAAPFVELFTTDPDQVHQTHRFLKEVGKLTGVQLAGNETMKEDINRIICRLGGE